MENPTGWLEILSIVSSIVSLIIGGLAIWLAVKFYEMSSKSSEKLEQASNNIDSTTKRLETLFDKLYADTFAMVKDTVSDMRKHVWKADETNESVSDERLEQLKKDLVNELSTNFDSAKHKEELQQLRGKVTNLLEKAVDKSASISKEAFAKDVLDSIKEMGEYGRKVTFKDIISFLGSDDVTVVNALFTLRKEGKVTWGKSEKSALSISNNIKVTTKGNS